MKESSVANRIPTFAMSYLRKRHQKNHAARARQERLASQRDKEPPPTATESQAANVAQAPLQIDLTLDDKTDSNGQCDWDGTINNYGFKTDSDADFTCSGDEASDVESDGFSEFGDDELLQLALRSEAVLLAKPIAYHKIMKKKESREWKKAERKRGFGYTGNSVRTKQRRDKEARDKEAEDEKL